MVYQSSVLHSQPKSTVGTPAYIAPEVLSRKQYDGKVNLMLLFVAIWSGPVLARTSIISHCLVLLIDYLLLTLWVLILMHQVVAVFKPRFIFCICIVKYCICQSTISTNLYYCYWLNIDEKIVTNLVSIFWGFFLMCFWFVLFETTNWKHQLEIIDA